MPTPTPHPTPSSVLNDATQHLPHTGVIIALMLAVSVFASPAHGQDNSPKSATLTPAQSKELSAAVELARKASKEDPDERKNTLRDALKIYDGLVSSLDMDLIHLNRGRVLQKLDRCEDARASFDRIEQSMRDPNIEREVILRSRNRYLGELRQQCLGTLEVVCDAPEMTFSVAGTTHRDVPCGKSAVRIQLQPGDVNIEGNFLNQPIRTNTLIRGTEVSKVMMSPGREAFIAAGRILLSRQQYATAVKVFKRASKEKASGTLQLYIAEAYLGSEDCKASYETLKNATSNDGLLSPAEFKTRKDTLQSTFSDQCGELTIFTCSPEALFVKVDDATPFLCERSTSQFISLGQHTITATSVRDETPDGETPQARFQQSVQIQRGKVNEVEVTLDRSWQPGALFWWGTASASLGTASLVTALVLDRAVLQPELNEYNRVNKTYRNEGELQESLSTIETLQTTNNILLISGGALVVTGAILTGLDFALYTPPGDVSEPPPVSFRVAPHQATLLLQGTW